MLINVNSNGYKIARGLAGLAAGMGTAVLVKDAISKLDFIPTKKHHIITVAVATFAIGGLASQVVNKSMKSSIDEAVNSINTLSDDFKGIKVTVTDALKA